MSGHTRLNASQYMKKLTGDEIVQKFPQAFVEDPNLTPEIFYDILRSVKFDVKEAQLKVIELVRKPGEFLMPAALLNASLSSPPSSSPTTPQTQNESEFTSLRPPPHSIALPSIEVQTPPQTSNSLYPQFEYQSETDGLAAAEVVGSSDTEINYWKPGSKKKYIPRSILKRRARDGDSDDELLVYTPCVKKKKRQLPIKPSSLLSPTKSSSSSPKGATDCGFQSKIESDEDEPPHSANRRFSSLRSTSSGATFHAAEASAPAAGNKSSIFKHQDIVELSSGEEDDADTEDDFDLQDNQKVKTPRSLSTTPDFGDESEYEVPGGNEELRDISPEEWQVTSTARKERKLRARAGNPNEAVLQHRTQSLATPWLHTLANPFYPSKVSVIEGYPYARGPSSISDLSDYLEKVRVAIWDSDLLNVDFEAPSIWKNRESGKVGYASVTMNDGVVYYPGDCVIVRGTSPEKSRKNRKGCDTQVGDQDLWYARIVYLYKDIHGGKAMAHLRWFSHGAATAIGELASTHELFLLTECNDEEVSCIASKISVVSLERTLGDSFDIPEKQFEKSGNYYYFLHYNPDKKQYTDVAEHETRPQNYSGTEECECCDRQAAKEQTDDVRILGPAKRKGAKLEFKGFKNGDDSYFLHDFVYVYVPGKLYHIGQIMNITTSNGQYNEKKETVKRNRLRINLDMFARFDEFHPSWLVGFQEGRAHAVRDERRLYYTAKKSVIRPDQLDGKCYVRHPDDINDMNKYKDEPDMFWAKDQVPKHLAGGMITAADLVPLEEEDLYYSEQSMSELLSKDRQSQEYLNYPKLRGMEVFAGAGGLTAGLELSQAVESLYAVEFSEAACRTYRKNFPNSQVCCEDASLLLEHAVRRDKGEELEPILDCHGQPVPNLPQRGEIDFICGGCPCPGYSGLNRYKQTEDIKNSLLIVLLSYVDFYRPKYFLLENVRGLLTHRLGATQVGKNKMEGGIENGTVKFMLRALTSMGYQVHFALLQAAEHGVPSSRNRVFFWASLPGYPLPNFPQPEHLCGSTVVRQEMTWYRTRRSAPHRAYTVGDSVTDLPAYEWSDPRGGEDEAIMKDRQKRWNRIQQFEVVQGEDAVGLNQQSYDSKPLCEYQRKLRTGVGKNSLTNHVTQHWSIQQTILVCDVPLWPGADHRDVPDINKPWFLYHPDSKAAKNKFYPGRYGRLDMEELFDVCLTSIDPSGKNGRVLHPFLHRVISIREYARAMGFPDWFIFDLDDSRVRDIIRQIGNAVPPPLAKSLGKPLRESHVHSINNNKSRRDIQVTPKKVIAQGSSLHDAICLDSDED